MHQVQTDPHELDAHITSPIDQENIVRDPHQAKTHEGYSALPDWNGTYEKDEQQLDEDGESSESSKGGTCADHDNPFLSLPQHEDIDANESTMNTISWLQDTSKRLLTWSSFLSVLCICGVCRFTKLQYDVVRLIAETAGGGVIQKLSTYKHVREKMWRDLCHFSIPRQGTICMKRLCHTTHMPEHTARVLTSNGGWEDPRNCARIVLPTEWAKLDVNLLPWISTLY